MANNTVEAFEKQVERWHRSAVILHSLYISLGIVSVISSVIVATFIQELGTFKTRMFAALSASSVALIETTGVGRKGNGFRQAQRHLRAELIKYKEGQGSITDLIKAFSEAEMMIGDVLIKTKDLSDFHTEPQK